MECYILLHFGAVAVLNHMGVIHHRPTWRWSSTGEELPGRWRQCRRVTWKGQHTGLLGLLANRTNSSLEDLESIGSVRVHMRVTDFQSWIDSSSIPTVVKSETQAADHLIQHLLKNQEQQASDHIVINTPTNKACGESTYKARTFGWYIVKPVNVASLLWICMFAEQLDHRLWPHL